MKVGDEVVYVAESCYIPKGTEGKVISFDSDLGEVRVRFYKFTDNATGEYAVDRTITCQETELLLNKKLQDSQFSWRVETTTETIDDRPFRKFAKKVQKIREKTREANASPTGSLRYNNGKPEVSHIAPEFLLDLASLMSASAKKYSKWNYAKGQYLTTPADSLMRHFIAFMSGENDDPESKHSHLVHIAANALIMWCTCKYHLEKHPDLDDRFKKVLGIEGDE